MTFKKISTVFWDYAIISFGVFLYAAAWTSFVIPNNISSGGLTGACTNLQYATGIPVSYSYIIANAILLTGGVLVLGKGFGFKTIYAIALSTILLDIIPRFDWILSLPGHPLYISEKVLIPIIAGLMEAIGLYCIFNRGGSTGGTDVIALIINKFWPISPGKTYIVLDVFIIATILLIPGKTLEDMVYGYIMMITFSLMLDFMLLGQKSTVQLLIFSSKYEEIADYILYQSKRGVTVLNATGWYTKEDRKVLLILVRKNQLQALTRAIKSLDAKAFLSVSPASGVYGEGFDEIKTGIERKKGKNAEPDK